MNPMIKRTVMVACTMMLVISGANAAFAKGGKHDDDHPGKGRGKHEHSHKHDDRDDRHYSRGGDRVVIIAPNDRRHIRSYLAAHHCPPGLSKKHNGCVPPGHVKRYVIGQALPPAVIYQPVPQPLLVQLQPVPVGYQYVQVDQDVLLISEATHHVVDAITLLSAVH